MGPAVVGRIRGVDRVVPVEHPADAPQLPREVSDVLGDEVHRIDALLEGEVLRVDPEGVEADGFEDVPSGQALKTPVHVGAGERVDVAHMESLGRGVREHHQLVVGVLRRPQSLEGEAVGAELLPPVLPLGLYFGRRVAAVYIAAHLCALEGMPEN